FGTGRSEKRHEAEAVRLQRRAQLRGLFGRQIGDDRGIAAGGRQVGSEPSIAALAQWVVVRHECYWRFGRAAADQAYQFQGGVQRGTAVECPTVGALHGGAVRKRIGERNADLKAVRASVQGCFGQRVTGRHVREARGQIRKQSARAVSSKPIERPRKAIHAKYSLWPEEVATV